MEKKDIKDFTIEELRKELNKIREASYRAGQIFDWIYKKGACDFSGMSNMPAPLRDKLGRIYDFGNIKLKDRLESCDGTEKFLFELSDGCFIETVFISSGDRNTVCLSTQVGCKYACVFCASGTKGFIRNLTVSEILGQVLFLQHNLGLNMTNFVFMGMGEPFDNYANLSKAILIMNSTEALGIGARRITVSTCGVIPGIEKLKRLGIQVNLSISLHAADNKLRNALVPINKIYPLEKLIAACKDYMGEAGRMITLEYILIKGKNDSSKDAAELSRIALDLKAKVNLIPYSPVPGKKFKEPSRKDMQEFKEALVKHRVNAIVRESKGKDIQAACGQLAMRETS
ncbi:MAG: 23S rRNA (adenine(2503)-C(2))-methyltransferase RlmN [Candidatus Omnitrophica bacterium]|nr:23S rRNA (adenine(2503)-C(2))-methyltransferase RlmN [Candidatus Omnitrophota bacterium]